MRVDGRAAGREPDRRDRSDELEEDEDHEADEGEGLGEGDAEEHGGAHHAGGLGLAGHGLDGLADEVADADARADGGEAVGDAGTERGVGLLTASAGLRRGWRRGEMLIGRGSPVALVHGRLDGDMVETGAGRRSVLGVHRAADVHGGEDREDVGLQERDQHLEAGEGDEHANGERQHERPAGSAVNSVMQSTAKVTSRMWPASMLAKSRTASEKGRTMNVEMNSIGVTRM